MTEQNPTRIIAWGLRSEEALQKVTDGQIPMSGYKLRFNTDSPWQVTILRPDKTIDENHLGFDEVQARILDVLMPGSTVEFGIASNLDGVEQFLKSANASQTVDLVLTDDINDIRILGSRLKLSNPIDPDDPSNPDPKGPVDCSPGCAWPTSLDPNDPLVIIINRP